MNYATQIIVPLDVPCKDDAITLIQRLPEVEFWKVGLELFVADGSYILKYLQDEGKKIFLDLKFHDIPNTIKGAVRSALTYDIDLLTLHITAGREALMNAKETIQAENNTKCKLLGITLLTSLNSRELALDLKIPLELPEYTLNNAIMGKECGLDGAVCSPHEAKKLKEICGEEFLLVCPGVRPSWGIIGDQKRVMTPKEAFKEGADYLVIGRPITHHENPSLAWGKITEELQG